MKKLIGPFTQILPLTNLPLNGPLKDSQLQVTQQGSILVNNGWIVAVGNFDKLRSAHPSAQIEEIQGQYVLLPGFVDCHTHICFAGSGAGDYALRQQERPGSDTCKDAGGIWDTVTQTRLADEATLTRLMVERAQRHYNEGVTTIEVKSGYGLSIEGELKQLRAIKAAATKAKASLVATCLAAHKIPKDFGRGQSEYLNHLLYDLLPVIKNENLAERVDICVDRSAFNIESALNYVNKAKDMGFDITVHADQFTIGGSDVAIRAGAVSADHLEASKDKDIKTLAKSGTAAVVLPGASMGLGMPYAPARKLLDAGACLAIGSDWNPVSAPMGDLLMQAAVMGAAERLSTAEVFAALTTRAAKALNLTDRGALKTGMHGGLQAYPCSDYREILYNQGKLKPVMID